MVRHGLTKASNWIGNDAMGPDFVEAIHAQYELYGGQDKKLKTELRVYHASFPDTNTTKGM